jgi:hypothetical protein
MVFIISLLCVCSLLVWEGTKRVELLTVLFVLFPYLSELFFEFQDFVFGLLELAVVLIVLICLLIHVRLLFNSLMLWGRHSF